MRGALCSTAPQVVPPLRNKPFWPLACRYMLLYGCYSFAQPCSMHCHAQHCFWQGFTVALAMQQAMSRTALLLVLLPFLPGHAVLNTHGYCHALILPPSPCSMLCCALQVYKGVLRSNNEPVAVKVQRPGVRDSIALDIFILRRLAGWFREAKKINR